MSRAKPAKPSVPARPPVTQSATQPVKPGGLWALLLILLAVLTATAATLLIFAEPPLSTATPPNALISLRAIPLLEFMFLITAAMAIPSLAIPALQPRVWFSLLATGGLAWGLLIAIPYENAHVLESGHLGLTNLYEVSLFILAVTSTLALGFDRTHTPGRLLPFVTPILAVGALFLGWLASIGAGTPKELIPALQNNILPFHVAANFIGYGCFAIAAAAGAAMLLRLRADNRHRASLLPPVDKMEKLAYRAITLGFPVFTVAILLGCLWAYQAWGGYWSWDPKETWALIVWLIYAAYLHVRLTRRPSPAVLGWWLLGGFAATLFCYLGVNMFLSGLHSYGTLQP